MEGIVILHNSDVIKIVNGFLDLLVMYVPSNFSIS
jgi:hypothetical protein